MTDANLTTCESPHTSLIQKEIELPCEVTASAWDMNPSGEVVGNYTDAAKKNHGFLLIPSVFDATFGITPVAGVVPGYQFVSIDYPGASSTAAVGINAAGHIVGSYIDSAGKTHAYLLMRGRRRD